MYSLLILSIAGYVLIGYFIERSNFELLITVYSSLFLLSYLILKNKTILIGRLSWKKIDKKEIIEIVERSLVQLRFDLKSEVDIKLLKFINPD